MPTDSRTRSGVTPVESCSSAVSCAWVVDADLEAVAATPSLEKLDLSLTRVTDLGLLRLKNLPNVRELNLSYAELVTDEQSCFCGEPVFGQLRDRHVVSELEPEPSSASAAGRTQIFTREQLGPIRDPERADRDHDRGVALIFRNRRIERVELRHILIECRSDVDRVFRLDAVVPDNFSRSLREHPV